MMMHPNEERLLALKQVLNTRLAGLNRDLAAAHSADSAEQAVERENDQVLLGLKAEAEMELQQIGLALERMERGDYGECDSCGEPIAEARLAALPFANRCINCAE